MAQPAFGRPTTTVDLATWTITGAATAHEAVDEGLPGDAVATRVNSPNNPANSTIKLGGLGLSDPGTDRGHRVRVMWRASATAVLDLTVTLRKSDGTQIGASATRQVSDTSWFYDSVLLTEAAISGLASGDYAGLELWVTANKVSGGNVSAQVTMVELEVPGSATFLTPPTGVPAGYIGYWTARSLNHLVNGASIVSFADDSGFGRGFQTNIAIERPVFTSTVAALNGLPAISFRRDGTNRESLRSVWDLVPHDASLVVHLVTRLPASGDNEGAVWGRDDASSTSGQHSIMIASNGTAPDWGMNNSAGGAHVFSPANSRTNDNPFVIGVDYAATDRIYVNGVDEGSGTVGSDGLNWVRLGDSAHTGLGRDGNFDFCCALLYGSVLTSQNHADISTALLAETGAGGGGPVVDDGNRMGGTGAIRRPGRRI